MGNYSNDSGFSSFLHEAPIGFVIFFVGIVTVIVVAVGYAIIKGTMTWSSNNQAELVNAACKIVGRRTEVWGGSGDSSANTEYFVTFEFEDGSRKELHVKPAVYGLIAEGDQGTVQYQGTRFIDFNRLTGER